MIPESIMRRAFSLVNWPNEHTQAPQPPHFTDSGAVRTCPRCNDADGTVHWKGTTVCPWCGFDTEALP